jgi:hypothetical protein
MNLELEISPDDERMLNDILDNGINEIGGSSSPM